MSPQCSEVILQALETQNNRIIVLDRDPEVSQYICEVFFEGLKTNCYTSSENFESEWAIDGDADLIVVDTTMPRACVQSIMRTVRSKSQKTRFILTSLGNHGLDTLDFLDFDVDAFIEKPFDIPTAERQFKRAILHSKIHKINDELVRLLGDLVNAYELTRDESSKGSAELISSLAELKSDAVRFIHEREELLRDYAHLQILSPA